MNIVEKDNGDLLRQILVEKALYEKIVKPILTGEMLLNIELFKGTFDAYCVECSRPSVFHRRNVKKTEAYSDEFGIKSSSIDDIIELFDDDHIFRDRNFSLTVTCSRSAAHEIQIHFVVKDQCLIKIGQFPSLADLQRPEVDKYRSILSSEERSEFVRAVGLNAHGIGIGAFTYLRRIFESLIEKAGSRCEKLDDWDDEAFRRARMDDKINLLRLELPELLVSNHSIYSILSKGLHELSEEECLQHFGVLKLGIELILDEELERMESDRKRKTLTDEIATIKGQLRS